MAWSALGTLLSNVGANIWSNFSNSSAEGMSKKMMQLQHMYNVDLQNRQFEMNKYFTENGHQAEVRDLRAAGLNPVLSANNGAYSQVGLPSSGLLDVAQGSSALSNAKTAHMDMLSQLDLRDSTSALNRASAKVEQQRANNVSMDTQLKASQVAINNIDKLIKDVDYKIRNNEANSWDIRFKMQLEKDKAQIRRDVSQSVLNYAGANSATSQAERNRAEVQNMKNNYSIESGMKIGPWTIGVYDKKSGKYGNQNYFIKDGKGVRYYGP